MELRIQLQIMHKNDPFAKDYIMCLRTLVDHLSTIEENYDRDLVLHAISGLDSNYNPFVSSFTMRYDCVSFDEFLLTYERRLKNKNS